MRMTRMQFNLTKEWQKPSGKEGQVEQIEEK